MLSTMSCCLPDISLGMKGSLVTTLSEFRFWKVDPKVYSVGAVTLALMVIAPATCSQLHIEFTTILQCTFNFYRVAQK